MIMINSTIIIIAIITIITSLTNISITSYYY